MPEEFSHLIFMWKSLRYTKFGLRLHDTVLISYLIGDGSPI